MDKVDFYDDTGFNQLAKFVKEYKLAKWLKTATLLTPSELAAFPDSDFALVILTKNGNKVRKYPVNDKAHTALSTIYFYLNKDTLPAEAQAIAAHQLQLVLHQYDLRPWDFFETPNDIGDKINSVISTHTPDDKIITSNLYRDLKKGPMEKVEGFIRETKEARSKLNDDDFALVTKDHRIFPINTPINFSKAASYFMENKNVLPLDVKHTMAKALYKKASIHNKVLPTEIKSYYSETPSDFLESGLRYRIKRAEDMTQKEAYKMILDRIKNIPLTKIASLVAEIDKIAGLTKYDRFLPNPYNLVFSPFEETTTKQANVNNSTITVEELQAIPEEQLVSLLGEDTFKELLADPATVYPSLPDPYKETIQQYLGN